MPKNLPIPSKSTELTLGKAKSLLGITAKILKGKALSTTQNTQALSTHKLVGLVVV